MYQGTEFIRTDGNTGTVRQSNKGIMALIAPGASGLQNVASTYGSDAAIQSDFGTTGQLPELASWMLAKAKKPLVLVRGAASVAGAYSAITKTGGGTSTPGAGVTEPNDDYNVVIDFIVGGTIGVAGITYKYSVDGGAKSSAVTALGTATSIVIPGTGITVLLAAGTIVAGNKLTFTTTAAAMNNADVVAALEALRVSTAVFEGVAIYAPADGTIFDTVANWLSARKAEARFYFALLNSRFRGAAESESAYATAMSTEWSSKANLGNLYVSADGFETPNPIAATLAKRYSVLDVATAVAQRDYGEDISAPSYGNRDGVNIVDKNGNPKFHNEINFPTLDQLRMITLTTRPDRQGTYITDSLAMSPTGSDWVYLQYTRVMNRADAILNDFLVNRLSLGFGKETTPSGAVRIREVDALEIEGEANAVMRRELAAQVDGIEYKMSRQDDVGGAGPKTVNGSLEMSPLLYPKKFVVKEKIVRSVSVTV